MQNQKGINKTIYYQNDKLCVTELTFPSVKKFKKIILTTFNEEGKPVREDVLFLGLKHIKKKIIVFEYRNEVCIKHILTEGRSKAFYSTKFSSQLSFQKNKKTKLVLRKSHENSRLLVSEMKVAKNEQNK